MNSPTTVNIPKGILAGLELQVLTSDDLRELAQSSARTELSRGSFYKGELGNAMFQGITFRECNFARVKFRHVNFSRCSFICVDLTRANFADCYLSDTAFINSDPYNLTFEKTEIDPSSFRRCFAHHSEWNKALLLFSDLRLSLKEMGETRASRSAEYYFRVWQRRRLFHRWRFKKISSFITWFWSLCLGGFTGYGERPSYLAIWAFGFITALSLVYMIWFPSVPINGNNNFMSYWYYSFKVFFAQGLDVGFQSMRLAFVQMGEFLSGLVMVALLIGSIARKLSP